MTYPWADTLSATNTERPLERAFAFVAIRSAENARNEGIDTSSMPMCRPAVALANGGAPMG